MRMSLDAHELVDLANLWEKAPEIMGKEFEDATNKSLSMLESELKDEAFDHATGASGGNGGGYRDSIHYKPAKRTPLGVEGVVGTSISYAIPLELGTKPHMPPVAPIQEWVQARLGITTESESKQVVYAIAMKIKKHGTKGKFIFKNVWQRHQGDVVREYRLALGRVRDQLAGI